MPGPLLVTAALALLSTVAVGAPVSKPSAWLSDADFRAHLTIGGTAGLRLGDSAPGSTLVAWHEQFWELVHPHAALDVLVEREHSFAHEAPLFFVSARLVNRTSGAQRVQLFLLDLGSGRLEELRPEPPILMANGAAPYGPGTVVVCAQGTNDTAGGLVVLDLATQKASPLVNNWGGLPFNSPNDVTLHAPSGALLFTDPDYGASNGHRPQPLLGNWVWRFDPASGAVTPLADGFTKPNGVAFNADFTVVYVAESGAVGGSHDDGAPQSFVRAMPAVWAFDVAPDAAGLPTLRNRRLLAALPTGVPDGLKVDAWGNVWAGGPVGVEVFSPSGQHLGTVAAGPSANLAFAGRRLLLVQETRVAALPTKVAGEPLPRSVHG